MKSTFLPLTILLCLCITRASTLAADPPPDHAEFSDALAVQAWQDGGFNPPTLWFYMDLGHGECVYVQSWDEYDTANLYQEDFGSAPRPDPVIDWGSNPPSEGAKEAIKEAFNSNFNGHYDNIGPEGVGYESRSGVVNGVGSWSVQKEGYWRGRGDAEVYYGNVSAGVWGATGQVAFTRLCYPVGEGANSPNAVQGNSSVQVDWGAYAGDSDEIPGSTLSCGGTNVRIQEWFHP